MPRLVGWQAGSLTAPPSSSRPSNSCAAVRNILASVPWRSFALLCFLYRLTSPPTAPSGILAQLSSRKKLPAKTIKAGLADDAIVPALRTLLTTAADGARMSVDDILALNRALHLLASRHDKESWQPLLRLLHRGTPANLILPASLHDLSRIVVSFFDGDAEALFACAADRSVPTWHRASLIDAITVLTCKGTIAREKAKGFLQSLPVSDSGIENLAVGAWMQAIMLLGMRDLAPLVYHRMTTDDCGERVENRPFFDSILETAEENQGDLEHLRIFSLDDNIGDVVPRINQDLDALEFLDNPNAICPCCGGRIHAQVDNVETPIDSGDDLDDDEDEDEDEDDLDGVVDDPADLELMADLATAPYFRPDLIKTCQTSLYRTVPALRAEIEKAAASETLSEERA
ncbi:MAG: DUF1186 family protein [Alphaproteobacteria bacterium]|nr:DUF1186 family protein [Alphaproteobacteria bacterium]